MRDLVVLSSSYISFVSFVLFFLSPLGLPFGDRGSRKAAYLLRTIPLLPLPLLIQQKGVVIIRHNRWGESPWT